MRQINIKPLLQVAGVSHPYWTDEVYARHEHEILAIKRNRQQKDWFRHSPETLAEWLDALKRYYREIKFSCNYWCFSTLLQDSGFAWHLLNCLEPFYKHRMHVSIIECINFMVDSYIVHESGCDEYDRDSEDNSVFQHTTLCVGKQTIPWVAICLFVNEPWAYQFMQDDLDKILIRQLRSVYRKTDRPGVFSSLTFNSVCSPIYLESSGKTVSKLLNPDGIRYPITAIFQKNPKYKNFGELFLNLISENPVTSYNHFFNSSLLYVSWMMPQQFLFHFICILRNQCKDVVFTQEQFNAILMKFLEVFPNSRKPLMFSGFLFQNFLRNRAISLQLRQSQFQSFFIKLEPDSNEVQFESKFMKRIKMLGFLEVMLSPKNSIARHSYSIMRRVTSGLFL
jgi:hypothetical protein